MHPNSVKPSETKPATNTPHATSDFRLVSVMSIKSNSSKVAFSATYLTHDYSEAASKRNGLS
jgi:hypothetical protein